MLTIGIDVGLKGGIAVVRGKELVSARPMPVLPGGEYDEHGLDALLCNWWTQKPLGVIEQQMPFRTASRKAAFNHGMGYAYWRMAFAARGLRYVIVPATKWKRYFGVTKDKNTSIHVAARLFPGAGQLKTATGKWHDGKVEAALIALYGQAAYGGDRTYYDPIQSVVIDKVTGDVVQD